MSARIVSTPRDGPHGAARTFTRIGRAVTACFAATCLATHLVGAQSATPVSLTELQRAAVARDPRAAQRDLLAQSSALRMRIVGDALRPQFTVSASNTHASDVTYLTGVPLPGGAAVPIPPRDRWSGTLDVSQMLYDGGGTGRHEAVESARLAEGVAGVSAALEPLRAEVTRNYFAAALLQGQENVLASGITDLAAVLAETRERVRAGAALGRDSATVRAEWRGAQAQRAEVRASRHAAVATLTQLTGIALTDSTPLALPEWDAELQMLDTARDIASLRARPEFARLALSRARLGKERDLAGVANRPKVIAFAEGGYGRPGLNQFKADPAGFWQAGVKVEWQPFTWGSAARNAQISALQERVVSTEEQALADQLARAVQGDLASRARLKAQLVDDDEVIALRQEAFTQGEAQRREGVITAAEAVQLRSALTQARLTRERHRVELARAESNIVTTLGLTPR